MQMHVHRPRDEERERREKRKMRMGADGAEQREREGREEIHLLLDVYFIANIELVHCFELLIIKKHRPFKPFVGGI